MSVKTLHIFNPEHDLALAVGNSTYTPPAEVVKIRKNLSLLPAIYAGDGDFILLPPEVSPEEVPALKYFTQVSQKNLHLLFLERMPEVNGLCHTILPWGWDAPLKARLLESGVDGSLLPDEDTITQIRRLSHRNLTIPFREKIAEITSSPIINLPQELFSVSEVEEFLTIHPLSYFKAPWSSSGRGIVVSDHITRKGLLEWVHGIIRRQGSVMAEPTWNRTLDFATEWWIKNGEPEFVGYSVFDTSSRGKYHGNRNGSQEELLTMIRIAAPDFTPEIIDAQKSALKEFISPFYNGPVGIDMFVDNHGLINPCVEINLRMTMGLVNILKNNPNLLQNFIL